MYTQLKKEKNIITYEIKENAQKFEEFVNKAYEANKGKYAVQGFRKGHVPRKVIEQNYGKEIFMEDALLALTNTVYSTILQENPALEPVDRPTIEVKKMDADGVEFLLHVTVMPEVKLGAYTGLDIEKSDEKVDEKAVEDELAQLQNRQARFVDAVRAAQMGDVVVIDFVGKLKGKKFDGGAANDFRLELGSGTFIPGFEDQIVGMNIGEKRVINVRFPEDYFEANLKGQDTTFDVTLNKVEEKQLPALDDEFASSVSEFNSLAELRADIKKHLAESVENQNKIQNENKIIEKIVAGSQIDLPDVMVQNQLDTQMRDFEMRLKYQGATLKDYFDVVGTTEKDFREQNRAQAELAVKSQLVMREIIKAEKLQATQEEIDKSLQNIAEKAQKTTEDYKKTLAQQELNYVINDIIIRKVFDFLFANNNLK